MNRIVVVSDLQSGLEQTVSPERNQGAAAHTLSVSPDDLKGFIGDKIADVGVPGALYVPLLDATSEFMARTLARGGDHQDPHDPLDQTLVALLDRSHEPTNASERFERGVALGDRGLQMAGGMIGRKSLLTGAALQEYAQRMADTGYSQALAATRLDDNERQRHPLHVLRAQFRWASLVVAKLFSSETNSDWAHLPIIGGRA